MQVICLLHIKRDSVVLKIFSWKQIDAELRGFPGYKSDIWSLLDFQVFVRFVLFQFFRLYNWYFIGYRCIQYHIGLEWLWWAVMRMAQISRGLEEAHTENSKRVSRHFDDLLINNKVFSDKIKYWTIMMNLVILFIIFIGLLYGCLKWFVNFKNTCFIEIIFPKIDWKFLKLLIFDICTCIFCYQPEPKPRRRAPEAIRPKSPSILSRLTHFFRPKPGLGVLWKHERQKARRQQFGKRERIMKALTDCVTAVWPKEWEFWVWNFIFVPWLLNFISHFYRLNINISNGN